MSSQAVIDRRSTHNNNTAYGAQFHDFYDNIFPPSSFGVTEARWVAGILGNTASILELGVGTGRIALPLVNHLRSVDQQQIQYVGVDLSPNMITTLLQKAGQTHAGDTIVGHVGDIRTYQETQKKFTAALCLCATLSMVGTADDQQETFHTSARHLDPGARLIVETHNPPAVRTMFGNTSHGSYYIRYRHSDAADAECGMVTFYAFDGPQWNLDHVWIDADKIVRANETSRLTSVDEIDAYATRAGFRLLSRHADLRGSEFDISTSTMSVSVYAKI